MIKGEVEGLSMFDWLKFLPLHTFSQRHFESSDGERSALGAAKRRLENGSSDVEDSKVSKLEEEDDGSGLADDEDE